MIEVLKKSIENDDKFFEQVKKFGQFVEFMQSLDDEDIDNLNKMLKSGMLEVRNGDMMVFPCYGYMYVQISESGFGHFSKTLELTRYADRKHASTKSFKSAIEFLFEKRRDMKMEN